MKLWRVDDVMTTAVVSVDQATSYRDVVDLLVDNRVSAVPVVDAFGRVIGVVSEADLLRKIEYAGSEEPRLFEGRRRRGARGKASAGTAGDLMSVPPVVVLRSTPIVAAARLMDSEDVKRLPVVDDLGRLVGIVTRSDLLKVNLRSDDEVLTEIETDVLRMFLADDSSAVTTTVADGVVTLAGRVDRWSAADLVARLTRQIPGVVEVIAQLEYDFDDRKILHAGSVFGAD